MNETHAAPSAQQNDPARKGQLASRRVFFDAYRFAVAAVHTRFNAVEWFVWDVERVDEITEGPAVVGQCSTFEEAVARVEAIVAREAARLRVPGLRRRHLKK